MTTEAPRRRRSRRHQPRLRLRLGWLRSLAIDEHPAGMVALGLLAVTVVVSPQLFGGVFAWSTSVIAVLAALSAATAWWAFRDGPRIAQKSWPAVAIAVAVAWTALQALPLPCALARWIAPKSAAELSASMQILEGSAPAWCTISRDAGETRQALVVGAAILAMFIAAWMASIAGHRRVVFQCAGVSALLMAIVALGHEALNATSVFGVYQPVHSTSDLLAPLMNENNLAGFLVLGTPILLTLGLESEHRGMRIVWLVGSVVTAGAAVLTLSRGGIAALIAASVLLAFLVWRPSIGRRSGKPLYVYAGLVAAAGIGLGVYAAAGAVEQEFEREHTSKLDLITRALQFAFEQPITGVGRGAFSAAFVERFGTTARAVYAENLPAQWAAEWGIPIAVGLVAVLVWAIGRAALRTHRPSVVELGAIAGIAGIAAQNLVDFGLELSGVAVVASALLGAVTAPHGQPGADAPVSRIAMQRVVPWLTTAIALITIGLSPMLEAHDRDAEQRDLVRYLVARNDDGFREVLADAVRLHPSEPAFALLAGAEARQRNDPAALAWLARAMQLAPGWASPHVEAARWLLARGRTDQALLELREAAKRDVASTQPVICPLVRRRLDAQIALRAAPPSRAARIAYLGMVAECTPFQSEAAERIDQTILHLDGGNVAARVRHVRRLLAAGRHATALAELRRIIARYPTRTDAQLLLAETLIAADKAGDAIEVLQRAERYAEDPTPVIELRARAYTAMHNEEQMRRAIEELRGLAHGSASRLGWTMELLGGLEQQLGNDGAALHAYEDAYRFHEDSRYLVAAATVAERLGDTRRAYRAYAHLCELEPTSVHCRSRDRLRDAWAGTIEPP